MSKIGYIQNSYGSSFNVAIANTYSTNVLNSIKLPANTFIIAAPFDNEEQSDLGTYSLILTDSYGTPVRITYCIKEGNGFYNDDEHLYLHLDNSTLLETNDMLNVNLQNIILDDSLKIKNGKISVNIDSIGRTSNSEIGTIKVDGKTIKSDGGEIYVETSKLDFTNSSLYGIGIGDGVTLKTVQGKLSVKEYGLVHGTNSTYGFVKGDTTSIISNNGVLSLNQSYFINDSYIGIVKPDNITIKSTNGTLSIKQEGITKASSSNAGVVSLGSEFFTNANGQTSVSIQSNAAIDIDAIKQRIDNIHGRLDIISQFLS